MKLLYLQQQQISYNCSHKTKEDARRKRHLCWLKDKRKRQQGTPKAVNKELNTHRTKFWNYSHVAAPVDFSLISNTEAVIDFISAIEDNFKARSKVFVVLKNIINIDYGAIVVLLSIMVKFSSHRIDFDGDFPNDPIIKQIIRKSGFFDNLFKTFKHEETYEISAKTKDGIYTHASKNVDSLLGASLISAATEAIWGEQRRCQGVQRALVELMQNTNNHAVIGKTGDKHWWLSVNQNKEQRKVSFSFVDFGVGVFKSLENKKFGSKFYDWAKKIAGRASYKDNADLLRLIFAGELHQTVTGKPYRGKGLPGIAEAARRNQLSNLVVITNNVVAFVESQQYTIIKTPFNGTFVYWELGENNESCK